MRTIKLLVGVVVATLAYAIGLGSAQAEETFTFRIKSNYTYKVQIAFFSHSRSHEWPGPGQAFSLDDSQTQSFPLSCRSGEKICYGAWVTGDGGTIWGTGPEDDQGCTDCCYVCDDGEATPVLTLDH